MKDRELYKNAIEDARLAEVDEIFPLYELKDGENLLLSWNDFPEEFEAGEFYTARKAVPLWCVSYEELREWFKDNSEGVTDWNLRLEQLIGLPEGHGYTHFTAFSAYPEHVIRPAYQTDPQKQITPELLDGSALGEHREWFCENMRWSYREAEWPWTRLGYTYDWSEGHERGLCEFIILPGADIKVEWILTTEELIEKLKREDIMENSYYTFETYEDDYKRKWLDVASGTGEVIIIPEDIYGISPDAFRWCEGVKKVWVPERTKVIGKDAFIAFDQEVTIYCAAPEKPEAWYHKEDGMTAWGFGADSNYEIVVNSWQGSYVYTCDNDDRIIQMHNDRAKVVWGSRIEDLK